jgi:hypothetical protein
MVRPRTGSSIQDSPRRDDAGDDAEKRDDHRDAATTDKQLARDPEHPPPRALSFGPKAVSEQLAA